MEEFRLEGSMLAGGTIQGVERAKCEMTPDGGGDHDLRDIGAAPMFGIYKPYKRCGNCHKPFFPRG